ncbi:MAG: tryptophan--tRNA ligase [Elusimicrobiota bacterium]|nr:tryptophan--tRNA ligase [Endomicrobiia bacterium]MDW8165465.1 tryptophan--tRNA ligase [Elusimicrobiota bacterium]
MKKIILSGMRPTGKLHIGHYAAVLKNWVELQKEYDCFFMVADLHALTTEYTNTKEIKNNTYAIVADWLSCGIDPEKSVVFCQSDVPEHSELHLILSMLTPLGWLYSCPTYKEQLKEQSLKDLKTYGFLGYPVLQAADILLYKSQYVPVGKDQIPHVELTRQIARRFNSLYGDYFPEPKELLTETPYIPGIDGRKMSKSYNNCIYLTDTQEEIEKKILKMFTDPKKIHKNDPGDPTNCVVLAFHKVFNKEEAEEIEKLCREGKLGCVEDKRNLSKILYSILEPIRKERGKYTTQKIEEVLLKGKIKAQEVAKITISEVKNLIGLF